MAALRPDDRDPARLPWHRIVLADRVYDVQAVSRQAAVDYLQRVLADPRPYEPGTHIKVVR